MNQKRIEDYGIHIGTMRRGPLNKITDVPGVKVGNCTIDTPQHKTGVTLVIPQEKNMYLHKLPAAAFVWNGFGKTTGTIQIQELGTLETPIALTNTLNVGLVQNALVDYMVTSCQKEGTVLKSINPVVCECNDSTLNQIQERAVGAEHVKQAISNASADFLEGDVGAGKGTICHGLKGGIGSASRQMEMDGDIYTLGILVQSNYGRLVDLTIAGKPTGKEIADNIEETAKNPVDKGSIIMIIATDLPVSERQLYRIIKRASVGLARLGSYVGNGSGEVMIGFTTADTIEESESQDILSTHRLRENRLDEAFRAVAEACEEAVLNSMVCADRVIGYDGTIKYSLREFL